ncbi:MAG: hypothetical protein B7Z55_15085, partial [Planctomycetales bacterium 12-60-4]
MWKTLAFCLTVGTCVGCGGGLPPDAPKLAPAAGVVTHKGSPLPNVTVTLYPESGPVGVGKADGSGQFQIKTNGRDGATIGTHKVTISPAAGEPPPMDGNETKSTPKEPPFAAKYIDLTKT